MSAPTSGNFDCARLQEQKLKLSQAFVNNGVVDADLMADVAPLQMIRSIQTARFPVLQDPQKDNSVKLVWLDNCADTTADECSTDECAIDGVEGGTQCADYTLDICLESPGIVVTEKKFREMGSTIDMDLEVARMLAREMQGMDQALANQSISKLDSWAGENLNTSPYTVSGNTTTIPAAAWNPDLFGYFAVTRQRNKLPNMKLLLGGLMEQYLWKVQYEASTPEGQAAARKVGALGQVYSDMFTTEAQLGSKAAFLVNPDSVAFVSKAYHAPYGAGRTIYPSGGGKQILYTINSLALPGVVYDVIYQEICDSNDVKHTWKLKVKAGLFLNPTGCNTDRTGVLKFVCG